MSLQVEVDSVAGTDHKKAILKNLLAFKLN
jgi:hypothetical protein